MSSTEGMISTNEFSETAHSIDNFKAFNPRNKLHKISQPKDSQRFESPIQSPTKLQKSQDLENLQIFAPTLEQVLPESLVTKSSSGFDAFLSRLDEKRASLEMRYKKQAEIQNPLDILSILADFSTSVGKITDPSLKFIKTVTLKNKSIIQKFEKVASGTHEKTKAFTSLGSLELFAHGYIDEQLQETILSASQACKGQQRLHSDKTYIYAEISFPTASVELSNPLSCLSEEIKHFFPPNEKLTLARVLQFISVFGLSFPEKILLGGKFIISHQANENSKALQEQAAKTLRQTVFSKSPIQEDGKSAVKCIGGNPSLRHKPNEWLQDLPKSPNHWQIISVESWRWSFEFLPLDLQVQFQNLLSISQNNQNLFYESGEVYQGPVINGRKSGRGKSLLINGDSYEGDWLNDKKEGKGKFSQANGYIYEGGWQDNKRHGKGKITNPEGDMYEGDWVFGRIEGEGKYSWKNGDIYEGSWKNNKKEGKGKFTWRTGAFYEGDWLDNKKHGKGIFSYANGDFYEGDWQDDQRHGQGHFQTKNGEIYQGTWDKEQKTGFGKLTQTNGLTCEGAFLDGQLHGFGICRYPNGDVYEGEWAKGKKEGRGKYIYTDGRVYDGNWKNDVREANFNHKSSSKKDCCSIF